MKKVVVMLLVYLMPAPAFSQNIIFQDNFEKGRMNSSWVYGTNSWSVANLESLAILPAPGGNNFALTNNNLSVIQADVAVGTLSISQTQHLSFYYRVHSKDARGTVQLIFLDQSGNAITTTVFNELKDLGNWSPFNEEFKIPGGTNVIRLKLGFHTTHSPINIFYQNVCIGCIGRRS
jgi:hypothetical protein